MKNVSNCICVILIDFFFFFDAAIILLDFNRVRNFFPFLSVVIRGENGLVKMNHKVGEGNLSIITYFCVKVTKWN